MTTVGQSAETRLNRLLERLLTAAEESLVAGDLEPARATAEEVRAVDPDNPRAGFLLRQVAVRQLGPSGERVLMSLLFADLVGSTVLSEQVEPEQLRDLFAAYRATARESVHRYRGHLVHYSGDGILAGFGHPEPHEDDARRAVLAGLDLVTAMRDARAGFESRFGIAPEVRVGLHTGRVVITDSGDDVPVFGANSFVGLVPTLAARIQQVAEPGMVVISDVTQQLVDADFFLRSLGEHRLTGISRPVEVFAVERPRYAAARFQSERYRKAGLVGRDIPRDRLLSAWEAAREGASAAPHLVTGEAGIGKTRLVVEVLDRVQAGGGQVFSAACLPYHANVSLWPIARLLERMAEGGDDDRLGWLVRSLGALGVDPARAVPLLGPLIGVHPTAEYPAPELDPGAVLDETIDLIVDCLTAAATQTPGLCVLEDVHWADPSTLELLRRLSERRPPGLLTVATARDTSTVPWADSLQVVELGRFDLRAARELVDNLAAGRRMDDPARARVIEQAEGIPLFIEELTRSALDERRSEPIPLRLQELLTWRLKAPGVDLKVVQCAATIGPVFESAVIAAVIGDPDAVAGQLQVLTDAGIVEPVGFSVGVYRFRHALMRDAAYETQVMDVRRATHAAVADALAPRGAEPALVAQHLDLAGAGDRAAARYLEAAQLQQGRGAHPEAARLLSRALELLETLPASDDRDLGELSARMLRGLSTSSMHGYASPGVGADYQHAQSIAVRLGRPEALPVLIALWAYWFTSGPLPTARGVLDQVTAMMRDSAYASVAPEVESLEGFHDFHRGHLRSAQDHLQRALAGFADRPADQRDSPLWPLPHDAAAGAATALAAVSAVRGELDAAEHWERVALGRAEQIGFPRGPFSLALAKVYAAWVRRFLGDVEAAQRLGAEVVAIGREHGFALWAANGAVLAATETPGRAPDREFIATTAASLRLMGHQSYAASQLTFLARLDAAAGDLDRADAHLAQALAAVRRTSEDLHLPELLRQRAEVTLLRGTDPDRAVADLTEAVRVATEQGARVSRLRAALDLARQPASRRPAGWRTLLSEAREDMPASTGIPEVAAVDALLDR